MKHKFVLNIDVETDEVVTVKWNILKKLDMLGDSVGTSVNIHHPMLLKIRLFSIKGGIELLDSDMMGNVDGQEYIFFSMGEDFDHSVRWELIQTKKKLGEGGFG